MQRILYITENSHTVTLLQTYLHQNNAFKLIPTTLDNITDYVSTSLHGVLLDLSLTHDLGVLQQVQYHLAHLPIIIISQSNTLALAAIEAGAQDYLMLEHTDAHHLVRVLHCAIVRHRVHYYVATHDALTQLANRHLLQDRLKQTLAYSQRYLQSFAVLMLDIDNFKQINDHYGHGCGDNILQTIAMRLRQCIRKADTAARFGGDEFVILLTQLSQAECITTIVKRITTTLTQPILFDHEHINVTVSVGYAVYPQQGEELATLLQHADLNMYQMKKRHSVGHPAAS